MTDRSLCKYFRIPGKVQSTRLGEKWSDVPLGISHRRKMFWKVKNVENFFKVKNQN
jgi:hypothetical protein